MINLQKNFKLLTLAVILVSIIILGMFGFTNSYEKSKDIEEIKKVIVRANELEQRLPILPEPYAKSLDKVPDEVKAKHLEKIRNELSSVFSASSPLLAQRIGLLTNAVEGQIKEDFRAEDGGVKAADFKSIDIDGDVATVSVNLTMWSKITDYSSGKKHTAAPEGTMHFIYTLRKEDGKWKITGLTGDFLPGPGHP